MNEQSKPSPIYVVRVRPGETIICPKALRMSIILDVGLVDLWGKHHPRNGPSVLTLPDGCETAYLIFAQGLLVNAYWRGAVAPRKYKKVKLADWNDQWAFCVPYEMWRELTGIKVA